MLPRRFSTRMMLGTLLSLFVFVQIVTVGVLSRPQVAHAQVTDPAAVALLAVKTTEVVKTNIFEAIWDVLVGAITAGVIFLAQRVAYDTAIALADKGAGKTPVFQLKNFDEYLLDTAEDAMAQALDVLATDWVGLDICKPLDIRARLSIHLGLRQLTKPQARCTWEQIGAAWDDQWEKIKKDYGGCSPSGRTADGSKYNFKGSNSTEDCMLALARDVFKPSNTELGVSVEASLAVQNFVRKKELASTKDREEGQGFTPVKSLVSQHIKTPAKAVAKEAEGISGPNVQMQGFQAFSGVLGSGAKGALGGILGIFANTFLSRMGSNVMDGLFKEAPSTASKNKDGSSSFSDPDAGSRIGVSSQVAALLTKTVSVRDAGLYDILSQFVSCSSESGDINRRPDECVLDTDFETAVRSAESGDPLTIKQAMEKDLLKKNWKLVSPSDVGLNMNEDCRNQAYCHSNIAKLRLARIVPLGFEIAAALSPIDNPWTFGEVVAGFNNCNPQGGRDDGHPFCHLVDPNWILKAPLTRCKAEVPGPMLATQDTNIRHSICVDKPTCLQDDGKGSCESPWGYCMREKNIWRFDADSCPAQFSTCTTYNGVSPGAQPKATYLSRTVDFATCTEQDVGCREYRMQQSRLPNDAGVWIAGSRYFNGKATTCTQPGCSQFIRQDGSSVYLKKAPLYLQCYDTILPDSETVIDWPEKLADLVRLQPRTECKDYAPVCVKDEVGCTRYTPENGDPDIPAIAGAGDKCANECVGYSTYKQMPSAFERAKFPLYFIPTTANQCSGAEVGCDQFVNVERGERAEYYSFVRQCEKPDSGNTNGVVFYAWEGSDAQGYQLRSYVLKRGPRMYQEDPTDVTPMYAAAYDAARVSSYQELCNKDLYTQRLADPDCRELFDRAGNAYYRLLSKTITVSDECTTMRKTDADIYYASRDIIASQAKCTDAKGAWSQNQGCQICEGGGALQNGVCLYAMMKSEATSCRAEVSGCRAYTGNAGNNVRVRYTAKFDDLDTIGWSDGTLSAESVVVGGKSLRVDDGNVSLSISSTPAAGSSYLMNFWAKGQGTLTVTFDRTDAEPSNSATFRLTGDWRQFSLGPMYVKSVEAGADIVIAVDSNVPMFLDNVVIRETIDTVNVIKNSWQTPASCDANPNDKDPAGNPIPGEALGCQAYRDHNGVSQTLKSFTRICRDVAVGCERLTDTKNTPELEGKTYRVWCGMKLDGHGGRVASDHIDPDSRACTPDWDSNGDGQADTQPVCTIPRGKDYCTFTINRVLEGNELLHGGATNLMRVPADDIAYLVNRQEFRCDAKEKGCAALGEVTDMAAAQFGRTPQIKPVNKLIDAEKYEQLLCTDDVAGCEAYSSNVGGADRTAYFRDPSVTGKPLCEFKENVDGNSGWFVRGISNPCYAGYRVTGNLFGVRSQGDQLYTGNVGLCPEQYNACKEFRDSVDTSQLYPEGQPYYVLDNAKIDKSSCNGQGSLQEGCVLFNDGSDPTRQWNATSTYTLSASRNGALVSPVVGRDSNTILKVTRDRACAEWLSCQGAQTVLDKTTNQPKTACSEVALCNKFPQGTDRFEECINWVTTPQNDNQILDENRYARRSIGWYDKEYSGFSLFDKYQIYDYKFVKHRENGATILVAVPWRYDRAKAACDGDGNEGRTCSIEGTNGKCYGGLCTLGIGPLGRLSPQCRGYATPEAPFTFTEDQIEWESVETRANGDPYPYTAKFKSFRNVNGFDRVNLCQQGHTCQCSYQKIDYGNGALVRYTNEGADSSSLPGFCRGGFTAEGKDKTGIRCSSSAEDRQKCRDNRPGLEERDRRDGECILKTQISQHRGWSGYCLETDESIRTPGSGVNNRPCLTWMPLDNPPGVENLDNAEEAGYVVAAGEATKYCVASVGNADVRDGKYTYYTRGPDMAFANSNAKEDDQCRDWAARRLLLFPEGNFDDNGISYFTGSLFMDVDHIKIEFSGDGRQAPISGNVNIVNDGISTPGVGGGFQSKPRIYGSDEECAKIAVLAGIINTPDAPPDERARYVCIHPGAADGPNAHQGMTFIKEHEGKKYLVYMWYAEGEGSGSVFHNGVTVPSLMYKLFYDSLRINKFGDYETSAECDNHSDGGAIAYIVGANGRFENKYRVALYNLNTHSNRTQIRAQQHLIKREICAEVLTVVDHRGGNVAWTDRLWRLGGYTLGGGGASSIARSAQTPPFGGVSPLANLNEPLIQRSTYGGSQLLKGGAIFSCPDGRCGVEEVNPRAWLMSGLGLGVALLNELFGKNYKSESLNDNRDAYIERTCPDNDAICYDYRNLFIRPPRVASLDMNNCKIAAVGEANDCRLGRLDRITINGVDNGMIIGKGYRSVFLRFFAWADTNRMPIRNIIVDWGFQNRITGGNLGKFKNKKTQCSSNSTPASSCEGDVNVTCSKDEECSNNNLGATCPNARTASFGNSPDACEAGFYEFFGSYNFQPDDAQCNFRVGENNPSGVSTAELVRNGLSIGDRYCAFKPRVIIIDNWGWCNGTCVASGGCWGSEDRNSPDYQKCTDSNIENNPEYLKVGTPFASWVIVAEQK